MQKYIQETSLGGTVHFIEQYHNVIVLSAKNVKNMCPLSGKIYQDAIAKETANILSAVVKEIENY